MDEWVTWRTVTFRGLLGTENINNITNHQWLGAATPLKQ
jgi:hypothetical protein